MRLIDADALLEKIDTERDILAMDGRLGAEHIVTHYIRNFIEDAPTVDRPQGEWTLITKGLPKEPGTVLITHLSPLSPSGREVVSAWYDDDGLFYDSGWGTMMYSDVLAWAYPPKPYMGE